MRVTSSADIFWFWDLDCAEKLRATLDAAVYKHVVLWLLFLKLISDLLESQGPQFGEARTRDGTTGCYLERRPEGCDEYTVERLIWGPPEFRWQKLQNQTHRQAPDMLGWVYEPVVMTLPIAQSAARKTLP